MYPVSSGFLEALTSSHREIDVRVTVRGQRGGVRLSHSDINLVDGEVTVDWTDHMHSPVRQAQVVLEDSARDLDPDLSSGDSNNLWFNCKLEIQYGLKVAGTFEYCPVFWGWVEEVTRFGDEIRIGCVGKESRHQPPYVFANSYQADSGTKKSQAIKDLVNFRLIDDDMVDIPVYADDSELKRNVHFALGMSPWKAMQGWARDLDRHLFFRADGTIHLREWPSGQEVAWEFRKGNESILVDYPDQRFSMSDFYNTVFVPTDRVVDDGPQTATRPEPVMGYATLPDGAALSAETLSGGGKPTIRIAERPRVRTFAKANEIADRLLAQGESGLEADLSIRCLPLPHLEECDIVKIGLASEGIDVHKFRAKRFNIPLYPEGIQEINWQGRRKPDHRHREKFGPRRGRRRRTHRW